MIQMVQVDLLLLKHLKIFDGEFKDVEEDNGNDDEHDRIDPGNNVVYFSFNISMKTIKISEG